MFPSLQRVVIVKQIPRYDSYVKAHLSHYANNVLDDLWMKDGNNKIVVAKQNLECDGELRRLRYGVIGSTTDGVHMRGKFAIQHMTMSFVTMLCKVFPHLNPTGPGKTRRPPPSRINNTSLGIRQRNHNTHF